MLSSNRRRPPMEIIDALNVHCGIPAKECFLAVVQPDGTVSRFLSPRRLRHDDLECLFFDLDKFKHAVRQSKQNGNVISAAPFGSERGLYKQPMDDDRRHPLKTRRLTADGDDGWGNISRSARRRQRTRHHIQDDDQVMAMPVIRQKSLKIGDSKAVYEFYQQRFKSCQQSACKLIAKAWVKVMEPKKQSTHPYAGGNERAPEWWPKAWGDAKEERVRHKEPDHLYKRERVQLLIHIMRLVVEPIHKQHPNLQKLNINVTNLEKATFEALSGWFAESKANASKKAYLYDVFRIAKMEEQFKNGSIDPSFETYVTAESPSVRRGSQNDDGLSSRDGEAIVSLASSTKPSVLLQRYHSPASNTATVSPPASDLPMRTASFATTHSQILYEVPLPLLHSHAAVGMSMPVGLVSPPPSTTRHGSLSQDSSTPGNSFVFSHQWSQLSISANTSPAYAYCAQQAHTSPQAHGGAAVSIAPTEDPGCLPTLFKDISRQGYDPTTMLRQPQMVTGSGGQSLADSYPSGDGAALREFPRRSGRRLPV